MVSSVSRSSISCGQFSNRSLADVSHFIILTKARCKYIEQSIDVICRMAINDGNYANPFGVLGSPGSVGSRSP